MVDDLRSTIAVAVVVAVFATIFHAGCFFVVGDDFIVFLCYWRFHCCFR